MISIHAPTRGATPCYRHTSVCCLYFNPRSHERSDVVERIGREYVWISIHAPTRGATKLIKRNSDSSDNFNPRSHERSDIFFMGVYPKMYISIHAPTRGATSVRAFISIWIIAFQSTLPREERHCAGLLVHGCYAYFNPRSHERSDHAEWCTSFHSAISIHAPTRGATQSINSAKRYSPISIHAPTRGATN